MRDRDIAYRMVAALTDEPWRASAIRRAFAGALGIGRRAWLSSLARKLARGPRSAPEALVDAIVTDRRFAIGLRRDQLRAHPPWVASAWRVFDVRLLAELVGLTDHQLLWLADVKGMNPKADDARLHHYRTRWIPKPNGARLLEAPKQTLKRVQRWVLATVLEALPPDPAAMGFVPGRGLLEHAALHVGKRVVVRMDLRDFFWSVGFGRVAGVFRSAGFADDVAEVLAGLCSTSTPWSVIGAMPPPLSVEERVRLRRLLGHSHLPQGAPTSPWLANLCAARMDRRLRGLARAFDATYSRYADDLAFSGGDELARSVGRLLPRAAAIMLEEGFSPNHRKTRVMRRSQRQELCGVVVNEKLSIARRQRERLEATLINVQRAGLPANNRADHAHFAEHLRGRVGWVTQVDPRRGALLLDLLLPEPDAPGSGQAALEAR